MPETATRPAAVTLASPEAGGAKSPADAAATWEPRIVAFFCNWCTYTAADLAGVSRMTYAPNARIIRLMCSGRVDPQFVLAAFAEGADGVLIGGCHPGDCHYVNGNYKTLRRFRLLRRLLVDLGIGDERFRLEWISASEGDKVRRVMDEMAHTLGALGPLAIPQRLKEWDGELASLAAEAMEANEAEIAEQPVVGGDGTPLPAGVEAHGIDASAGR